VQWLTTLEKTIRSGEAHPALASHLAKYRSLMPSLALLFEVADNADTSRVSLDHAKQAGDWCEYLKTHAERLYSCIISAELRAARELGAKIKAGRLENRVVPVARYLYESLGWLEHARIRSCRGRGIGGSRLDSPGQGRTRSGGRAAARDLCHKPRSFPWQLTADETGSPNRRRAETSTAAPRRMQSRKILQTAP
jgi:uncharacterized protein DUF3987